MNKLCVDWKLLDYGKSYGGGKVRGKYSIKNPILTNNDQKEVGTELLKLPQDVVTRPSFCNPVTKCLMPIWA